jgi:ATP-dependent protease ClpP protease subunit
MPNWNDILKEISDSVSESQLSAQKSTIKAQMTLDTIRRKYLAELHNHTGRNVIAYYSGWLSKPEIAHLCSITDEDKNGFMMAIHKLDKKKGLDLILHTPGGNIASTESLVSYLRSIFGNDIRAIIPQIAMSAGTMIACSCKSIVMGKHSNLGPIDPQFGSIPAHGIIQEFKQAYEEIKEDNAKLFVWRPILEKYQPTFLSQCENAIEWSRDFVETQLKNVMFQGDQDANKKAKKIVDSLSDYKGNKTHSRHISIDECKTLGLKIEQLEDEVNQKLQDLVLTVHHCYMHSLMNTASFKMIENHTGIAFVKVFKDPNKQI